MSANNSQFDPVAAGAQAALDATRRSMTNAQREAGAPEAPAQSQAFDTTFQLIETVAQFSPANVLARGDLPMPSAGGSDLPLPGVAGSGPLANFPTPDEMLPGGAGGAGTTPFSQMQDAMDPGSPSDDMTGDEDDLAPSE